jgi:FMN-dependent NADH-azoreductase
MRAKPSEYTYFCLGSLESVKHLESPETYTRTVLSFLGVNNPHRMLVRERGRSPKKYQHWLAEALVKLLLAHP